MPDSRRSASLAATRTDGPVAALPPQGAARGTPDARRRTDRWRWRNEPIARVQQPDGRRRREVGSRRAVHAPTEPSRRTGGRRCPERSRAGPRGEAHVSERLRQRTRSPARKRSRTRTPRGLRAGGPDDRRNRARARRISARIPRSGLALSPRSIATLPGPSGPSGVHLRRLVRQARPRVARSERNRSALVR
jgi:hypothetical protein